MTLREFYLGKRVLCQSALRRLYSFCLWCEAVVLLVHFKSIYVCGRLEYWFGIVAPIPLDTHA